MATVKKKGMGEQQFGGAVPFGNVTTYRAKLACSATGGALNADSTAALAIADVVQLEKLPMGMTLEDAVVVVSTTFTAAVTCSLGFAYCDGVDSAAVPQDAAYFGAGLSLATAARLRAIGAKELVKLPKEAFLIMTMAGANNAKAGVVDVFVYGERLGPK